MILNEIQKSIIFSSSVKIMTDTGFIEIYNGKIVNAEKNDGSYGIDILVDIIKNAKEYKVEVLEDIPITTITNGWEEIKNLIFNNEIMLFQELKLSEDEFLKFVNWMKINSFNGLTTSSEFIDIFIEGKLVYSIGLYKGVRPFNVYEIPLKTLQIISKSLADLKEDSLDNIRNIRMDFAVSGESGIILSFERFEVFEKGIRIMNITDEFPVNANKFMFGFERESVVKSTETPILTDKDMKVLSYILESSLKLLSEKVGKEAVNNAIMKYNPNVNDPTSVISCIKELLEKAKVIGGTGWIKKNINKISEGVKEIANEELRKLLDELFKI